MTGMRTRAAGREHTDVRSIALRAIDLCMRGMPAQQALNRVLCAPGLSSRDLALCTELTYGYLRARLRIDYILDCLLPDPRRLPSRMLGILGLSIYCLMFLRGMADYAVVDWGAGLSGKLFGKKMAGVANGALRNFLRLNGAADSPDFYLARNGDILAAQAIFHGLPPWLAHFWREHYPDYYMNFMRRSSARPRPCVRLNRRHQAFADLAAALRAAGLDETAPAAFAAACGGLPETALAKSMAYWFERGAMSWQAAGSQLVLHGLVLEQEQGPFWDCCAGVGGKTLWLQENGHQPGMASDISSARLMRLPGECARLGLEIPAMYIGSPEAMASDGWSGNIIVDAPCSGLGVLSRRPDILLHARQGVNGLKRHVEIQERILLAAAGRIRPGRHLAYVTCTLNPQENELQIERFLQRNRSFRLVRVWQTPHDHPWLEGMFGALLLRGH